MAKEKINTRGITAGKDDFSEWFSQLMIKAGLADYTKVSGCLVFRPASWAVWEKIRFLCDERFKKIGIENVYFPMFIPESLLKKEAEHVKGFSAEVAWIEKAGDSPLGERLAIRPTSEAIMYDSFSKWIRSWRDLPLKYNQWVNVVRWEFSHPVPFLRTREFIFNEIHTVHSNEVDAHKEAKMILDAYKDVCENHMALYGVVGRKTEKEKFAGAVYTEKIHYAMPNGRVIEGPAFHHDGQNFAKAYDIKFLDKNENEVFAYQNTAAISTRMLGAMFAIHSDDKGLILPPKMTEKKAVIVPIIVKGKENEVIEAVKDLERSLHSLGVFSDLSDSRAGEKFNEWELKGIPIRLEVGPKDVESKSVVMVRRDNFEKSKVLVKDLKKKIPEVLEDIQNVLLKRSKKSWESRLIESDDLDDLVEKINEKKIVEVPLSSNSEVEDILKERTAGAKVLYISEKKVGKGTKCIVSGKDAAYYVFVAKTY